MILIIGSIMARINDEIKNTHEPVKRKMVIFKNLEIRL